MFYRPFENEIEEYHPKATKTLFVGGLNRDVTESVVKETFTRFGEILDVDIKKSPAAAMAASGSTLEAAKKQCYANIQFTDLTSVCRAIRDCDGDTLNGARLKCGFARAVPKKCVWCSGIPNAVGDKEIAYEFGRYGKVQDILILRSKGQALIWFDQVRFHHVFFTRLVFLQMPYVFAIFRTFDFGLHNALDRQREIRRFCCSNDSHIAIKDFFFKKRTR